MALFQCDKENQVIEAVRSGLHPGEWDEALRTHLAACAVCRDTALVAEFLRQQSDFAGAEARLPDPGLVWWKAHLLARREAAERAVRPIAVAEKLAGAGTAAVALTGIVLNWRYVAGVLRWVAGFLPAKNYPLPDLFQGLWGLQIPLLLAIAGGLLFLAALSLYAVCAEE